eukprot:gene7375-8784_t
MSRLRLSHSSRYTLYQFCIFVAFYVQALCVAYLTPSGDISITVDHANYSDDGTRIQLERRKLFSFNVVSLVYLFLLISAAQHSIQGLYSYFDPWFAEEYQKSFGVFWYRWCDYLITAPIMMVVIAYEHLLTNKKKKNSSSSKGVTEAKRLARMNFFVLWAWLTVIAAIVVYARNENIPSYITVAAYWIVLYFAIITWLTRDGTLRLTITFAETNQEAQKRARIIFYVAIAPCIYAWIVVFVTFVYAIDASESNPPDFVYSINIVLLILFLGPFPYVHYLSLREHSIKDSLPNESLKLRCEMAHAAFGLISKSALAWMVYWGLRRLQDDVTISTKY